MDNGVYQEVELSRLRPSPLNPRKRFEGPRFDELVASVKQKGVIEPILARPVEDNTLEIVAGERRYRASLAAAEASGGLNGQRIPAMVRELSDDEAFDLMCIENLHREDLSELEEAEGFKTYLDRRGMDALPELAERTGINQRYIRRRVAVLGLPKKTLKAWESGELKYGHLEQLSRLSNPKEIAKRTQEVLHWRGGYSVRRLREEINRDAPALKSARFNLEKAGCPACQQNSDVQKTLFEPEDLKGAHCLDPACFKKHQNNWLIAHWGRTGYRKQHKTNGFRFAGDVNWNDFEIFHHNPKAKCLACKSFVTLIELDGSVSFGNGKVCIGDKACFQAQASTSGSKGSAASPGETETRRPPSWHGEYFREQFFETELPKRLAGRVTARIELFAVLKSNHNLREWFFQKHNKGRDAIYSELDGIWQEISGMQDVDAAAELSEAAIRVIMQDQYDAKSRREIAEHIGISLQEEWRITEEYLNKKTIGEILAIAEEFKVFEQAAAHTFLYEKLLKKRGNFKSCKKGELKRIFLESGVDLAGVVPAEILEK